MKIRGERVTLRSRLEYQMEKHQIKNAPRLATALYNAGLAKVKSQENRDTYQFDDGTEKRKNAIGSIKKKIDKHLQSESTCDLQGEFVDAYCKFFGCSADWLMGFTEIESPNVEVRSVCEQVGLSEKAVDNIRQIIGKERDCLGRGDRSDQYLRIVNQMFSSDEFFGLIESFRFMDDLCREEEEMEKELEKKHGRKLIDSAEAYEDEVRDYEHDQDSHELASEVIEAIRDLRAVRDRAYELNDAKKLARYELFLSFEELRRRMYPVPEEHHFDSRRNQ